MTRSSLWRVQAAQGEGAKARDEDISMVFLKQTRALTSPPRCYATLGESVWLSLNPQVLLYMCMVSQ